MDVSIRFHPASIPNDRTIHFLKQREILPAFEEKFPNTLSREAPLTAESLDIRKKCAGFFGMSIAFSGI